MVVVCEIKYSEETGLVKAVMPCHVGDEWTETIRAQKPRFKFMSNNLPNWYELVTPLPPEQAASQVGFVQFTFRELAHRN